jgi:hypothetical protein
LQIWLNFLLFNIFKYDTYKELQEKGVNITEPKKQDWGGIMSQIKDQDNNILTLISS